jgi:hypothetical protein
MHTLITAATDAYDDWMKVVDDREISFEFCGKFTEATGNLRAAAPKTVPEWLAKWQQLVKHEEEFDAGDADFNLKMMRRMVDELETIVGRQ